MSGQPEMVQRLMAVIKSELGQVPWAVIERIAVKVLKEIRDNPTDAMDAVIKDRDASWEQIFDEALKVRP